MSLSSNQHKNPYQWDKLEAMKWRWIGTTNTIYTAYKKRIKLRHFIQRWRNGTKKKERKGERKKQELDLGCDASQFRIFPEIIISVQLNQEVKCIENRFIHIEVDKSTRENDWYVHIKWANDNENVASVNRLSTLINKAIKIIDSMMKW